MFWGREAELLEMIPLPFTWYHSNWSFNKEMGQFAPKGSFHEIIKKTKLFFF